MSLVRNVRCFENLAILNSNCSRTYKSWGTPHFKIGGKKQTPRLLITFLVSKIFLAVAFYFSIETLSIFYNSIIETFCWLILITLIFCCWFCVYINLKLISSLSFEPHLINLRGKNFIYLALDMVKTLNIANFLKKNKHFHQLILIIQ